MNTKKKTITAAISNAGDKDDAAKNVACNITAGELLAILEKALSQCQGNPVIIINTGNNYGVICGTNNGTIAITPEDLTRAQDSPQDEKGTPPGGL